MSSFREQIAQRIKEKNASEADISPIEGNETDVLKYSKFFGIERVRNYPACLDLRIKDGKFKAIQYSYIVEINFDPTEGIEINTPTKQIVIIGRNLKLLYDYIVAFRVKYIQTNIGSDLTEEKELFISDINIEEI